MDYAVIGDIHGANAQLAKVLDLVIPMKRRMLFLGDYVNRGPDSKEVLESLLCLSEAQPETVFLCGNHDWAVLEFLKTGDFYPYASLGGISTIRSYCKEVSADVAASFKAAIPARHVQFLTGLRSHFRTREYLFSHTGIDVLRPTNDFQSFVLQNHPEMFSDAWELPYQLICGHYFQPPSKPYLTPRLCCIDTGCGSASGRLTCLLLPEREYLQVDERLDVFDSRRLQDTV